MCSPIHAIGVRTAAGEAQRKGGVHIVDDMIGRMGAILSDPESVRQLQELAQMLQQESTADDSSGSTPEQAPSGTHTNEKPSDGGFDLSMLLKMQELMGAVQGSDESTELLLALRPHLHGQRQKKVDQAVKLLRLYAVFSAVKENGLLQELL